MEISRKQELTALYEQIDENTLIQIARNENKEFEDEASEIAKSELKVRGITEKLIQSESDEEIIEDYTEKDPLADYNGMGEISGVLLDIPGFSLNEISQIRLVLDDHQIPYEIDRNSESAVEEYLFRVPDSFFQITIDLLKDLLRVGQGAESGYTGECPACGKDLDNVCECTECGLVLSRDFTEILDKHPFVVFLKGNDLL